MFYKTAEGEGLSCDDDDEKGKYDAWFFSLIMTLAQNTFYELTNSWFAKTKLIREKAHKSHDAAAGAVAQ